MNNLFDVVIIGGGPGGYVGAIKAAQNGLKTAVVEKDKALGGTCLHRGCIPTKALLENAEIYENILHSKEFGISVENMKLDVEAVQKRKNKIITKNAKGIDFLMKKNKITVFNGFGRLAGPGRVEVESSNGKQIVETRNIVLATGSVPKSLPGLEIDGKRVINSDHILELNYIPKSIVILGAGAVGVEFASIFHRFGSKITLVEYMPHILPYEDEEIGKELEKILKKQGMTVLAGTGYDSVKVNKDSVEVTVKNVASGEKSAHTAELLLVATGRRPVTEGIGIEQTAIKTDRGFVLVDEYCRTAEPNVYAIGDIIPTPQLAHVAWAEGILAADHIAGKECHKVNYRLVPSCTYCEPEVASVGLSERKAKELGYEVKVGKFPFSPIGKAAILGKTEGFVKVVADAKYDEVLGVHAIGPRVTELIAEAGIALRGEFTSEEIGLTMHAHPTLSEILQEAAHAVHGKALHF